MLKLGFVSAILPELNLEDVVRFASANAFDAVELMCWPKGKAERRYAGVTHVDVNALDASEAARIKDLMSKEGVSISGLGYYPNPLTADRAEADVYIAHIRKVIDAANTLGVGVVNTFVGRDQSKSVDDNWPRFLEVWRPLVKYAGDRGIKIGIENCPMSFSQDEWPGGKNLATTPAIWRRMFEDIPDSNFGLNIDPSHLVWQRIDIPRAVREFGKRIVHAHAKDARVDPDGLYENGVLAYPLKYHTPKLPGLGDVDWSKYISALTESGYDGPVCIEVEDRAYEGSLETRQASLVQSGRYLRQFIA
ncbi:MAG TPA: sugar phosphate isomerase/epimerase [Bryobacteraceae bacterium]|nr:sugar phosphate isomerase/epimerase [Bryobacteraceae bacterium]